MAYPVVFLFLIALSSASTSLRVLEKMVGELQDFYEQHSRTLNLNPSEMRFLRSTFQPVDAPSYTAILESPSMASLLQRQAASREAHTLLESMVTELDDLAESLRSSRIPFEIERVLLQWIALRQRYLRYLKSEAEAFQDFLPCLQSWRQMQGAQGEDGRLAKLRMAGFGYTIAFERLVSVGYQIELFVKVMFLVVRRNLRISTGQLGAAHEAVDEWMHALASSDLEIFEFRRKFKVARKALVQAICARQPVDVSILEFQEIKDEQSMVIVSPEMIAQRLVEKVFDACKSRELDAWKNARRRQQTVSRWETIFSDILETEISRCLRINNDEWLLSSAIQGLRESCGRWLECYDTLTAATSDLYDIQSDLFTEWEESLESRRPLMEIVTEEVAEDIED